MSKFLRIVNWDRFQHYKDRNPPWIKLHRDLLTSETWVSSDNDSRVLAIAIMMLAAATGNHIPASPRYIQRVAYLDREPDLAPLVGLNFIEIYEVSDDASKPLAVARPETETDSEKEDSVEANASPDAVASKGPTAIELRAAVFSSGVDLLTSTGSTDKNARSMLGRWRSDYGDAAVLDALAAATAGEVSNPIPWIRRRLEGSHGKLTSLRGSRPDPALDLMRQGDSQLAAERGREAPDRGAWAALPAVRTG